MQFANKNTKGPVPLLSQHRGVADGTHFVFELAWGPGEAECESPARAGAYPSPPMSGSPLSQKATSDASDRAQLSSTSYATGCSQDAYCSNSAQPSPTRSQPPQGYPPPRDPYPKPHPHDQVEGVTYDYRQPTELHQPRPLSYPQALPNLPHDDPRRPHESPMTQRPSDVPIYPPTPLYPPGSHSPPHTAPRHTPGSRPPVFSQTYISPKSSRKIKGHVASACVPCKRAHLRCDTQRPCARCLANGKGDSCIDVQHKKRGRPRLRDDREPRYDALKSAASQEGMSLRPLSEYQSGSSTGPPWYELHPSHAYQSHRILNPAPSEPLESRYINRAAAHDASIYGPSLSVATQAHEPVAYLTLDMEFSRVSDTFLDALGGLQTRRFLEEAVVPGERDKVLSLKNHILAERKQREPNYLPPILGRGDQVLQGLGFSPGDVARFQLNRQEYLTFATADDQPRVYPVRLGLAKEGSLFFIILVLAIPPRPAYPTTSHERGGAPPFYSQPSTSQPTFPQRPPGPAAHDFSPHRPNEGHVPAPPPSGMSSQILPGQNPRGGPTRTPSYSGVPNRLEYPRPPTYQTPRSEVPPGSQPPARSSYQLPPIRTPVERRGSDGDRGGRVDIGGLIEKKPEAPGRLH